MISALQGCWECWRDIVPQEALEKSMQVKTGPCRAGQSIRSTI